MNIHNFDNKPLIVQKVVLVGGANANDYEEETSSADGTSCGEEVVKGDSC